MGRGGPGARRPISPWVFTVVSCRHGLAGGGAGSPRCRQPPGGQGAGATGRVWAITRLTGEVPRVLPTLQGQTDTLEKLRRSPLLLAGRKDLSLNQQMIKELKMYI